jgi:hypothetical protein
MTRTTLKALWFGGGGILATWLAVSPNNGAPSASTAAAVRQSASQSQSTAADLNAQAARLRERTAAVSLRPSTRNPFRFSSPKTAMRPETRRAIQPPAVDSVMQTAPVRPALTLSGIARNAGTRTAIFSGDGQVYLAGEGESVAGRFTVIAIDPEAVLLRDAAGAEQRLVLPQQ